MTNIRPPTKIADEIIVDIEMNPPEERDYRPAEWDQMWAEFEYSPDRADRDFKAVVNLSQENWLAK